MKVRLLTSIILVIFMFDCGLFQDPKNPNELVELFRYTENKTSWAVDFLELKKGTGGYGILIQESNTPNAFSLVKLNSEFEIVWKQTFEFEYFTEALELTDGNILLSGSRSLILVNSDGTNFSRIETNNGQVIQVLQLDDQSIILYGLDFNYKPFLTKYNLTFEKIWEKRVGYNYLMTSDQNSNIYGVNAWGDSIRFYNTNGLLIKEFAVNGGEMFMPTSFKLDNSSNFMILGIENMASCCCNDGISLRKISAEGNTLWNRRLGNKKANDYSSKLLIGENFYAVCGGYAETNCIGESHDGNQYSQYACKINSNGNVLKEYLAGDESTSDGLSSIIFSNGKYMVAGGIGDKNLSEQASIYYLVDF